MLNPIAPDSVDRVKATLARPGMRTVCLFPAMQRYSMHDERVSYVLEAIAAVPGAAVFVHAACSAWEFARDWDSVDFDISFGNPLDLHAVALAFPKVPFIIPHFGAGMFREALMVADLCPNVYLDTSSSNGWIRYHPGLTLRNVFHHAMEALGPDRLLFGTDSSFSARLGSRCLRNAGGTCSRRRGGQNIPREF